MQKVHNTRLNLFKNFVENVYAISNILLKDRLFCVIIPYKLNLDFKTNKGEKAFLKIFSAL